LSLRSKRARAANNWLLDKAFENGVDKTDDYKKVFVNYKMVIKKVLRTRLPIVHLILIIMRKQVHGNLLKIKTA